jgi:DNA (cytosine-5)-methyltransferase 1
VSTRKFPVIDLFAGPGGLSEGFWLAGSYDIRLSVEKDRYAHETLLLRSIYHELSDSGKTIPDSYYGVPGHPMCLSQLCERPGREYDAAREKACLAILGPDGLAYDEIDAKIRKALHRNSGDPWVLIGGPPCQAYSLIGRARRKNDPAFGRDIRHVLYREYLRIIAVHRPAVFVMENVPGILSSRLDGEKIFPRIVGDLTNPSSIVGLHEGLDYTLYPLSVDTDSAGQVDDSPQRYVLRAEEYGVPQRRHRVILVGVRSDLHGRPALLKRVSSQVSVRQALIGIPELRSRLSRARDSAQHWRSAIRALNDQPWMDSVDPEVRVAIRSNLDALSDRQRTSGGEIYGDGCPSGLPSWITDPRLEDTPNHETTAHIQEDLWRYMFAATYAGIRGRSPHIKDFPEGLWPHHSNILQAVEENMFSDRFRVQLQNAPATTVVSHIAKDGHYYIHPDALQCRSLTVREAARLQTFPDNYFFCGPRTEQYHQVGNAVPPLLAKQIAEAVLAVFN